MSWITTVHSRQDANRCPMSGSVEVTTQQTGTFSREYYEQLLSDAFSTIFEEGGWMLDDEGVPVGLRRASDAYYADDCEFHVPGEGPFAFDGGKGEWFEAVAKQSRELNASWKCEVEQVFAKGDRGVVLVVYTSEQDGRPFVWKRANVYRFRDGKIVEVRAYEADQYGFDAFSQQHVSN